MRQFEILEATIDDKDRLCDMFLNHITNHPEYISHGEIQMGVGKGSMIDGTFVTDVSPMARHYWIQYITGNILDEESVVYKAVTSEGTIIGFCVCTIMRDGASPFGMLCDLLVDETFRGGGVGTELLTKGRSWFESKGVSEIYLESGLNNHAAHEYFMRHGFVKVSEIYKLM
jgi:ribosomal protein S18 acetylase RimI-like enzyme